MPKNSQFIQSSNAMSYSYKKIFQTTEKKLHRQERDHSHTFLNHVLEK